MLKNLFTAILATLALSPSAFGYGESSSGGYGESGVAAGQRPFYEQAANPATVANSGWVFTKDVAGISELFFKDSSANVLQMTSAGAIAPGAFGQIIIDTTNTEALLVRKDGDTGDV